MKRHQSRTFTKKPYYLILLSLYVLLSVSTCQQPEEEARPNVLWIVLEDTSPLFRAYDADLISTPHLDALAEKGTVFTRAFMPAPVCSPSRSSIITGIMSTTLGVHNHHSSRTPESAIPLPPEVKTIPELFKNEGYFTFNNGKDDYNFDYDRQAFYSQPYLQHALYGKKGENIELIDLVDKQPFFGQIQLAGGKEIFSSTFKERVIDPVDRASIELPPYLPGHEAIVEEYANHLDAIKITDRKVGDIINQLEANGLLKNTIVFFFSDHGMRLTRHKQFLYDGGLHVPLIIADFRENAVVEVKGKNENLVSGIDLGPTAMAMAGITRPANIEGKDIYGDPPREYVISTRDRCDFTIDRIRSVRTQDFKYIRNFMTDRPYSQPTYMDVDGVAFVKVMRQLYAQGELNEEQSRFFEANRPAEELYDLRNDPYELHNLADDPAYAEVMDKHANILTDWIERTDDQGQYPEDEEGLKLMLGIWGDHAVNPEYMPLREKYKDLASSQFVLKSSGWQKVTPELD